MTAALLTAQIDVGPLAPGAQTTRAHGIRYDGLPRIPNVIMPDRDTLIDVLAYDELTITFQNTGPLTESASFLIELEHTIQRDKTSTAGQIWKVS